MLVIEEKKHDSQRYFDINLTITGVELSVKDAIAYS